jgi:hypothetical protein
LERQLALALLACDDASYVPSAEIESKRQFCSVNSKRFTHLFGAKEKFVTDETTCSGVMLPADQSSVLLQNSQM